MKRTILTWLKSGILGCTAFFIYSSAHAQSDSAYFQQEVNYTIDVKLNDVDNTLKGFEEIQYINNSPHTLRHLYFHLWPNAYKNNETALAKQFIENGSTAFYYAEEKDRGYIDSLFFRVDGDSVGWKLEKENIDICKIYLKKYLKPGDTITITTPFFVKIPSGEFSRLGHIGQSYQITQWYPKPAVYDRNGWNQMPYLNQGEFYSEYGSFDVRITLPANYVVGATGDLYDCPKEEQWLETKYKETLKRYSENVNKVGNLTGGNSFPPSSTEWKTLRYKQKNVHDFGWFADKRWNVLKGEYELPKSGRIVTLWAFFTNNNARYWKNAVTYISDAVNYYSDWNGEYPYNQVTAVDGTISAGGGMEYPNVTVIGDAGDDLTLETVIVHEVGHNWFYGILGSNERENGWMDEGINSFNELRYLRAKYPDLKIKDAVGGSIPWILLKTAGLHKFDHDQLYYSGYLLSAREGADQAIQTHSAEFTSTNYGTVMYMKTASAFDYLRAYLGDKVFDKCMHAYYETWKFKHPRPIDLQRVFEKHAKRDLSWFFNGVITSNGVIDYKVKKVRKPNTKSSSTYGWMKYEESLVVKNKGDLAVPFIVQGITDDTVADKRWFFGHEGTQPLSFPNGKYDKIVIDYYQEMPEINRQNNTIKYKWNGKRLVKQWEPLRFKFLGELEDPRYSTIYWTPVVGANVYDGFMPGVAIYNAVLPKKRFEYMLMPMYSTLTNNVAGHAETNWHFNARKSTWLKNFTWRNTLNHYSFDGYRGTPISSESKFTKWYSGFQFNLRQKKARSFHHQTVQLGNAQVWEQSRLTCEGDECNLIDLSASESSTVLRVTEVSYSYWSSHPLRPWGADVRFRNSDQFNLIMTDVQYALKVSKRPPVAQFRLFAGFFLNNNTNSGRYNLRMDGQRGYHDYLYDDIYVGRNESEGLWSHQFTDSYGGFKTPTANGQSNKWLAALNARANVPYLPLFAFTSIGAADPGNGAQMLAEAGFGLNFGIGSVYLPLWFSKDIADEYNANQYGFEHRIRFTLNLKNMDPLRAVRKTMSRL